MAADDPSLGLLLPCYNSYVLNLIDDDMMSSLRPDDEESDRTDSVEFERGVSLVAQTPVSMSSQRTVNC